MVNRSRRPVGEKGRTSSQVSRAAVSKALTLREALLAHGDPAEIEEMLLLEDKGYSTYESVVRVIGEPETQSVRDGLRQERLHQRAEDSLRAKLVSGELIATGRDPRQAIDAPRVRVPQDLWERLEIDFKNASVAGEGFRIVRILVSPIGGLHIWKVTRRARLGPIALVLAPRSFDLLLALAEHAPAPVALADLKKRFYSESTDLKALAQGIATLRKQLAAVGLDRSTLNAFVINDRGVGYALGMQAAEITIED